MRTFGMTVAVAVVGLLFFTQSAQASEAELQQMQDRIANLENQLENDKGSFFPSRSEVKNSLSSMLENTSVDAWVAGSYNYNFEGFDSGLSSNANTLTGGYDATNSFQVDQVWISLDNAATEDSRGGAHLDFEWGEVNGAGLGGNLYSAYVSYLAPVGNGVNLDMGLLPTMLGAEVVQTTANFNITRGIVWDIQPVTNVGAVFSTDIMGFGVALGILNDTRGTGTADADNEKALTAQVSYGADDWSGAFSMVWGDMGGDDTGTYDFLFTCDAMDDVSAWINYTLVDVDDVGQMHGIAIAARMALNDDMGVALRGEVTIFDPDGGDKNSRWSVTGTGDYALTDHLTAKTEIRIDIDKNNLPDGKGNATGEDVAATIFVQLAYAF